MKPQVAQQFEKIPALDQLRALEGPFSHTLLLDGEPIVCGGAFRLWEGRACVWAYVSDKVTRRTFRRVHSFAKLFIRTLPFRRLEASIATDFPQGARWAESHGFVLETPKPMRGYFQNGGDAWGYALVRGY